MLEASVEEFVDGQDDTPTFLADLLASKKDISFQDMQSIGRAFTAHFDIEISRDATMNDIIVAQASRHAIVHAGGIVDRKMIGQLKNARPRQLKPNLKQDEKLEFTPAEIATAANAMRAYLDRVDECLRTSTK